MLCYRAGSESEPRTFGLVHFIQGTPHPPLFTPIQIILPEGHVWQWAGAAMLDLRGHGPCSRQKMPSAQDVHILIPGPFACVTLHGKRDFEDVVKLKEC